MGFRAPSAEEVYRYVLRMDEPDRSLTDRFGFSIIFVNDSSAVCTEFLRSHFVDLCHRTADRIRFIFFAELDEREVAAAAEDVNRHGPRSGGLLNRLLRIATGGSRFERMYSHYSSWEDLRPASLHPAHPENTFEKLGWKRDSYSSIPGLGLSLRFAQRMGIGRHVPCLVLFTDVGSRQIDIMPIKPGMSADEVYQHVRQWIDGYYEQNHATIEKWERTEKDIQALRSELEASLRDIRKWGDLNLESWETLRTCNRVIAQVQGLAEQLAASWPASLATISQCEHFPDSFKPVFQEFVKTVRRLENMQRRYEHVEALCETLQDAHGFESIFNAFHRLKSAEALFRECPDALHKCMDQMLERRRRHRDSEPELALLAWWSNASRQLPSFAEYRAASEVCASGSAQASQASKNQYRSFLALVRELPFTIDSTQGAAGVMRNLGQSLGCDKRQNWESSSAPLHRRLERYLNEVASAAPRWLTAALPSMSIGEAIPWKSGTPGKKVFDSLPQVHPLRDLVHRERLDKAATLGVLEAENDRFAAECKSAVLDSLQNVPAQFHVSEDERRTALSAFSARLSDVRANVEQEVYKSADVLLTTSTPKRRSLDQDTVRRLRQAMEAYREVTTSLALPYKRDPVVQSISIPISLADAANVQPSSSLRIDDRVREDLERIANSESEADALWEQVRREADITTPAKLLSQVFEAALGQKRACELRHELFHASSGTSGPRLSSNAGELLARLDLTELDAATTELCRRIAKPKPQRGDKEVLIDFMLQEIGADAAIYRAKLNPAFALPSYDYDVFLAHNSVDAAEVEAIGLELKKVGLKVWLDKWELPPGRLFQDEIERALPRTRAVAVLIGAGGLGPWERLEMRVAISQFVKRGAPVIPVLLPGASKEPELPLLLQEFSWVRFYSIVGVVDPKAVSQLVWGITGGAVRTQVA